MCQLIMCNWPDIFKVWLDNVQLPTVISSTAQRILTAFMQQYCIYLVTKNISCVFRYLIQTFHFFPSFLALIREKLRFLAKTFLAKQCLAQSFTI